MNVLESCNIENPYGKSDECAMLTITDPIEWFILHDLMTVGQKYTFNAWIKSNVYGGVTIGDSHFSIETEWVHCKGTFTAHDTDLRFIFSTPGTYYIYNAQLEKGAVATDWSPAPEDMATSEDLDTVKESVVTTQSIISDLSLTTNGILASVARIENDTLEHLDGIKTDISTLSNKVDMQITPDDVSITVRQEMANGTSKVVTETGYTFDDEGMTVAKSGSEMKTQITENGMTVFQNEDAVLIANNVGVDAKNLHATTYLIVGENSRFEDYGGRTGCFWIGG